MPTNCINGANFLLIGRYLDSLMVDPEPKHVLCGDFNKQQNVKVLKSEF